MKKKFKAAFALLQAFVLALFTTGCATNTKLLDGQEEIKKELAEIKKLIKDIPTAPQRRQAKAFEPADIDISNSPILGKPDAPVTIIEFTDYQCPFCRRFAVATLPQLIKEYVETGKAKIVVREFPLKSIHSQAEKLAQAALCAGDQGKYWEMHDRFFKGAPKKNTKDFSEEISELKLDANVFQSCLDSNKYAQKIENDIKDGIKFGVRGTPSFFMGKTKKGDKSTIHATKSITGAQGFPAFKAIIDDLLK